MRLFSEDEQLHFLIRNYKIKRNFNLALSFFDFRTQNVVEIKKRQFAALITNNAGSEVHKIIKNALFSLFKVLTRYQPTTIFVEKALFIILLSSDEQFLTHF